MLRLGGFDCRSLLRTIYDGVLKKFNVWWCWLWFDDVKVVSFLTDDRWILFTQESLTLHYCLFKTLCIRYHSAVNGQHRWGTFCVRTLGWTSTQYEFLHFDWCTPSDTYWTLDFDDYWSFDIHLACLSGFIRATLLQLLCWAEGSCETILWCISLCGLLNC